MPTHLTHAYLCRFVNGMPPVSLLIWRPRIVVIGNGAGTRQTESKDPPARRTFLEPVVSTCIAHPSRVGTHYCFCRKTSSIVLRRTCFRGSNWNLSYCFPRIKTGHICEITWLKQGNSIGQLSARAHFQNTFLQTTPCIARSCETLSCL